MDMESINSLRLLEAEQQLLELSGKALEVATVVRSPGAREHLRYGLGRRLLLLRRSIALVCELAPPERTRPLSDDEDADLNLHLNSIYVHIRGATDNVAWALALEHDILGPAKEREPTFQRQVGLFGRNFQRALVAAHAEFATAISRHCDVLVQLPQLRDPVAHRIPLYVVPSVLGAEEAERYDALANQFNTAVAERAFDNADEALAAMSELGTFRPMFAHSLREPLTSYPLHQRLGSDLVALCEIIAATLSFFRARAA